MVVKSIFVCFVTSFVTLKHHTLIVLIGGYLDKLTYFFTQNSLKSL